MDMFNVEVENVIEEREELSWRCINPPILSDVKSKSLKLHPFKYIYVTGAVDIGNVIALKLELDAKLITPPSSLRELRFTFLKSQSLKFVYGAALRLKGNVTPVKLVFKKPSILPDIFVKGDKSMCPPRLLSLKFKCVTGTFILVGRVIAVSAGFPRISQCETFSNSDKSTAPIIS